MLPANALRLIPFAVYLATYAPWFASGPRSSACGRSKRSVATSCSLPDRALATTPPQRSTSTRAWQFRRQLTTAQSPNRDLAMSLRPVLYAIDQQDVAGCGAQSCVQAEMLVGTPAMLAVPVLAYAGWRMFVAPGLALCGGLVGYCADWLPWFADIDPQQMYFFTRRPWRHSGDGHFAGSRRYHPGGGSEHLTHWGWSSSVTALFPRGDELCVAIRCSPVCQSRNRPGTWRSGCPAESGDLRRRPKIASKADRGRPDGTCGGPAGRTQFGPAIGKTLRCPRPAAGVGRSTLRS